MSPFSHPGGALSEAAGRAHRWAEWTRQIECPDPEEEEPPLCTKRRVTITINQTIKIHHE